MESKQDKDGCLGEFRLRVSIVMLYPSVSQFLSAMILGIVALSPMTLRSAQNHCQANWMVKYGVSRLDVYRARYIPFMSVWQPVILCETRTIVVRFVLSLTGQRASGATRGTKQDIHGI